MAERVEERVYVDRGTSGLGLILGFLVVVAIVVGVLWATGSYLPQVATAISVDFRAGHHWP
jgi:hypothetical protein